MKSKRVKSIQAHVAIRLRNGRPTANGIESEKHNVEMEMTPAGVCIDDGKVEIFVPFTNIQFCEMAPAEAPPKK